MTSPEKIEKLLNDFGETLRDLPERYDIEQQVEAEKAEYEWFCSTKNWDTFARPYPAHAEFMHHQMDIIEKFIKAMETAKRNCRRCLNERRSKEESPWL